MRQELVAIVLGCVALTACGAEDSVISQPATSVVAVTTSQAPDTTTSVLTGPDTTTSVPNDGDATTSQEVPYSDPAGGIEQWIAEADVAVLDTRDYGLIWRAWLVRVDEDQAVGLAKALAIEAARFDITDSEGMFDHMRNDRWLVDCAGCIQMDMEPDLALDFVINGGLFGERNPNPSSPTGSTLEYASFPGELGREPLDQIDYLVRSELPGSFFEWDSTIIETMPELESTEFIAAIQFALVTSADEG